MSSLSSTSELDGKSTLLLCPIIVVLVNILCEFLLCLVEHQDKVIAHLTQMESHLAVLYGQIQSWVQTTLETIDARFEARMSCMMAKYMRVLHVQINSLEARMTT